jgi:predicted CXXCH cytochrome family protein
MKPFRITRKKAIVAGLVLLALILGAGGGLPVLSWVRYSTTGSSFCGSCHTEYYKLWSESRSHTPEDAECTDCHAERWSLAPGNFSASDERISPNCIRCHEDILKQEKADQLKLHFIKISHKKCMEKSGNKCLDCHRNIVHDKLAPVSNRPYKVTCYSCHKKDIDVTPPKDESCKKCHYITLVPAP